MVEVVEATEVVVGEEQEIAVSHPMSRDNLSSGQRLTSNIVVVNLGDNLQRVRWDQYTLTPFVKNFYV